MTAIVSHVQDDPRMGGFNDLPPNFQEISEADFWAQFSVYTFSKIDMKQVRLKGENSSLEAIHLFFYGNDEGIGYARTYEHNKPIGQGYGWCRPKLYFKFGICEHEWAENPDAPKWNCYHQSKCRKCGAIHAVDSSG